jgi:hypothetical protein
MIKINIDKAKDIAHEIRRAARAAEFAPLDIKATIPSEAAYAETARAAVRNKYTEIQIAIDNANTVDQLQAVISNNSK